MVRVVAGRNRPLRQSQRRHRPQLATMFAQHLARRGFRRPFTRVIHYSGQAGLARSAVVVGREDSFQALVVRSSLEDVVATAEDVLKAAHVPSEIRDDNPVATGEE